MKRQAHKITIPRLSHSFAINAPKTQQHVTAWLPPGEPEVTDRDSVIKKLGLSMPDISTFHVAGFDLDITPAYPMSKDDYGYGRDCERIMVRAAMHIQVKGEDEWSYVQGAETIVLPKEPVARDRMWRGAISSLLTRLLLHELDESLFFDGKHHRDPHPGVRPTPPPREMTPLSGFTDEQFYDLLQRTKGQQL